MADSGGGGSTINALPNIIIIFTCLFVFLGIIVSIATWWFTASPRRRQICLNFARRRFGFPTVPLPTSPPTIPRPLATLQNEVDIEHLALNQIKVPRHIVEAIPTYIYPVPGEASNTHPTAANSAPGVDRQGQTMAPSITGIRRPEAALINPGHHGNASLLNAGSSWSRESGHIEDQDQCSICLEHFVPGETNVRQLPCGHIFNPGCIDQYLMHRSSLCPLCRQRVH
ncbi:hypothetical protein N7540_001518 [Penicillium herquei]|nr:hypothetical protein N7540_001518 [Penicillium herquei]